MLLDFIHLAETNNMQTDNRGLYVVTSSNLFLHVVIQRLDGVKAGLEPPVLLVPLSKKILQLAHLLPVFLVTHTYTLKHMMNNSTTTTMPERFSDALH